MRKCELSSDSKESSIFHGDRCSHSKCEHLCNDRGGETVECSCRMDSIWLLMEPAALVSHDFLGFRIFSQSFFNALHNLYRAPIPILHSSDRNECLAHPSPCHSTLEQCVNTLGAFYCRDVSISLSGHPLPYSILRDLPGTRPLRDHPRRPARHDKRRRQKILEDDVTRDLRPNETNRSGRGEVSEGMGGNGTVTQVRCVRLRVHPACRRFPSTPFYVFSPLGCAPSASSSAALSHSLLTGSRRGRVFS